jgi:hypothetical protein
MKRMTPRGIIGLGRVKQQHFEKKTHLHKAHGQALPYRMISSLATV